MEMVRDNVQFGSCSFAFKFMFYIFLACSELEFLLYKKNDCPAYKSGASMLKNTNFFLSFALLGLSNNKEFFNENDIFQKLLKVAQHINIIVTCVHKIQQICVLFRGTVL